ncbi:MAG TPA: hypothetical protein VF758_07205 [Candidatus Acidoferrum sp.]
MSDPELLDRIMQGCSYRFRSVFCPEKDTVAKITAARFQGDDNDWTVIECSLLPSGEVQCAMTCLLRHFEDPT